MDSDGGEHDIGRGDSGLLHTVKRDRGDRRELGVLFIERERGVADIISRYLALEQECDKLLVSMFAVLREFGGLLFEVDYFFVSEFRI